MGKQRSISMALLAFLASVVTVAAHSHIGSEDFSFSFLGASSNDSCANVDCQQGTCVPSDNALVSILFPYTCKCNSGWSTLQNVIPLLEIPTLPCNVPNCSLNLNCADKASAPAPAPSAPTTSTNTTACLVPGICGHGKCEITSTKNSLVPTFKCVCDPGYANVLNLTAGYCVNHCEINGGCQNLNLTLPGLNSPPPPSPVTTPADQTANAGTRISPEPPPQAVPSTSAGHYLPVPNLFSTWIQFGLRLGC
ncbi:hypothetical protein M758_1G107700 [Ceratodon purpureus]|nr:hypothetical protein M758_1G107700 [Ceratodon purpureus]